MEDLIKKVREGYRSPDILLAIKEPSGSRVEECQVLMLADKHRYEFPSYINESSQNAAEYFKRFYEDERLCAEAEFVFRPINRQGRLRTLAECGRYEDYFVVEIPGRFKCEDVRLANEAISRFVEAFKKTYMKRGESDN